MTTNRGPGRPNAPSLRLVNENASQRAADGVRRDYALDMSGPVRHVATVLDAARPEARSVVQIAETYRHPITADLHRVQLHEGATSEHQAKLWLIRQAIATLRYLSSQAGHGCSVQTVMSFG